MFEHVDAYAGDPILTLVETFHKDPRATKVNLGIGLYYDEQGRIPLLGSVRQAEAAIAAAPAPRSYLPMEGAADYRAVVQKLLFGADSAALKAGRVATIQTLGGSGALKVGADLLKRYFPKSEAWVSNPTWDNHRSIFEGAGIAVHDYPYYDANTGGVDFAGMVACLQGLPEQDVGGLAQQNFCRRIGIDDQPLVVQREHAIAQCRQRGVAALAFGMQGVFHRVALRQQLVHKPQNGRNQQQRRAEVDGQQHLGDPAGMHPQ